VPLVERDERLVKVVERLVRLIEPLGSPSKRPPGAIAEGNRLIPSLRACQQTLVRLDPRRIEVEERVIALDGSRRGAAPELPESHETGYRAETGLTEPSAPVIANVPTLLGNDGTLLIELTT
jgi:hypothetical protein